MDGFLMPDVLWEKNLPSDYNPWGKYHQVTYETRIADAVREPDPENANAIADYFGNGRIRATHILHDDGSFEDDVTVDNRTGHPAVFPAAFQNDHAVGKGAYVRAPAIGRYPLDGSHLPTGPASPKGLQEESFNLSRGIVLGERPYDEVYLLDPNARDKDGWHHAVIIDHETGVETSFSVQGATHLILHYANGGFVRMAFSNTAPDGVNQPIDSPGYPAIIPAHDHAALKIKVSAAIIGAVGGNADASASSTPGEAPHQVLFSKPITYRKAEHFARAQKPDRFKLRDALLKSFEMAWAHPFDPATAGTLRLIPAAERSMTGLITYKSGKVEAEPGSVALRTKPAFDPIEYRKQVLTHPIKYILEEILKNSFDANIAANVDEGVIMLRVMECLRNIIIEVCDNGRGFMRSAIDHYAVSLPAAFSGYTELIEGGQGLGLLTSITLTKAHGGRVEIIAGHPGDEFRTIVRLVFAKSAVRFAPIEHRSA